jgi:antitoxin (DNA-binding transcriptional repressor) of toxin-antitoxin stability system
MASTAKLSSRSYPSRPPYAKSASVAETKEHLSALLRIVEENRSEIVVERRGVPVAKIVPMPIAEPVTGYGWMKGSVIELGDIVGPTGEVWDVSDER